MTATVTAPDGVAEVGLNWRAGDSALGSERPLAADRRRVLQPKSIALPTMHREADYFIEATDAERRVSILACRRGTSAPQSGRHRNFGRVAPSVRRAERGCRVRLLARTSR